MRLLRQRVTEPPTDEATQAGRLSVLGGAVRRFVGLLALATFLVLVISVPMGLLLGASMSRSVSVGFYVIGSFLLIAGFFVGNRGPVRLKGDETDVAAGVGMFGIGLSGRRLRWATPEENDDAMASSAVFVAIGFVLIVIGIIADSRVQLL